eukprot:SAG25_NODE_4294_length_846_cov_1.282463_1_plen_113_part_00
MDDFRGICSAGNYAWLHESNITAIVEAARHALRGKKYHEFCVKKSLVKLCIVTGKCPIFTQKLNDALFEAKALYTPVAQDSSTPACHDHAHPLPPSPPTQRHSRNTNTLTHT